MDLVSRKMETFFCPFVEEIQNLFKYGFNLIESLQEWLSKMSFMLFGFPTDQRLFILHGLDKVQMKGKLHSTTGYCAKYQRGNVMALILRKLVLQV